MPTMTTTRYPHIVHAIDLARANRLRGNLAGVAVHIGNAAQFTSVAVFQRAYEAWSAGRPMPPAYRGALPTRATHPWREAMVVEALSFDPAEREAAIAWLKANPLDRNPLPRRRRNV